MSTVTLDAATHTYRDATGRRYVSVTELVSRFKRPFDPDGKLAEKCGKRNGLSPEAQRAEWDAKRDEAGEFGTDLHQAVDAWVKRRGKETETHPMLKQLAEKKWKGQLFSERILSSETDGMAGTADLIDYLPAWGHAWLYDFKTPEKGIQRHSEYGDKMLPPVAHLDDCNFTHYELQLNLYARMLRQKKVEVKRMVVLWFNRATGLFEPHECQDRRDDVAAMVEAYRMENALKVRTCFECKKETEDWTLYRSSYFHREGCIDVFKSRKELESRPKLVLEPEEDFSNAFGWTREQHRKAMETVSAFAADKPQSIICQVHQQERKIDFDASAHATRAGGVPVLRYCACKGCKGCKA